MGEIRRLLHHEAVRLLTLTGAAGAGKTRLAQALIGEQPPPPGRAVWFVDLAVVDHPADVPTAIAAALGIQESGRAPLPAILHDVLRRGPRLLVLDNFEHVLPAAGWVADLLAAAPDLSCLVTSRQPLHIRAERVFPVEPLPVPDPAVADPDVLATIPSVALFLDRARARRPDFEITAANAPDIAEICRRLDGLPLAVELAAAQVSVLSARAILARLAAGAPFVLGGGRDLPDRHQTLHAAAAWSYDLLDEHQQAVFRLCGVFSGTFTAAAVAALDERAAAAGDPLSTLAELADRNLVRVATWGDDEEPRFRLLETIREFATDLLNERGELADSRARHAQYFVARGEHLEQQLRGPDMGPTLDDLERDYDNYRAVLRWSLQGGELSGGLRLAGALHRFWMLRGHLAEARQWLERALAVPDDGSVAGEVRARALNAAGVLAGLQGDNERAEAAFAASLGLWRELDDVLQMAIVTGNLGLVAQDRGDHTCALGRFQDAERLYTRAGDRRGIAVALGSQGRLARQQGRPREAALLFERALALFREVGDPRGTANALVNLGLAIIARQEPERASPVLSEALQLRRALGNTLGVAECFEAFAAAAVAAGRYRRAARLLGAAGALREVSGAPLVGLDRLEYEAIARSIERHLSAEQFAADRAAGRQLAPSVAAADYGLLLRDAEPALATGGRASGAEATALTEREREVAALVASGLTNGEIAATLQVTRRTVGTHLEHIFAKLGVHARSEVAVWITQHAEPA